MELDREYIKKDLEASGELMKPFYPRTSLLLLNALTIITADEQKIFELENRLKECENGYEGTLHLERCKLHDAEEKNKELTEENERLRKLSEEGAECPVCHGIGKIGTTDWLIKDISAKQLAKEKEEANTEYVRAIQADTVRKMHSEIKERCIKGGIYPAFVASTIDQIAKEMLEGENGKNELSK